MVWYKFEVEEILEIIMFSDFLYFIFGRGIFLYIILYGILIYIVYKVKRLWQRGFQSFIGVLMEVRRELCNFSKCYLFFIVIDFQLLIG